MRSPQRGLTDPRALGRNVAALPRVLGRDQGHVGVRGVDFVALDLAEPAQELERSLAHEHAADGVEHEADERARVPAAELPAHFLDERPPARLRAHEHLPPRLGVDAVDEQPCVGLDPRVAHTSIIPRGWHPTAHPPPHRRHERSAHGP